MGAPPLRLDPERRNSDALATRRRAPPLEPVQQDAQVRLDGKQVAMSSRDEPAANGSVEPVDETSPVVVDVEQPDRLVVQTELRPRQDPGQLLERTEAARQRDEGIG